MNHFLVFAGLIWSLGALAQTQKLFTGEFDAHVNLSRGGYSCRDPFDGDFGHFTGFVRIEAERLGDDTGFLKPHTEFRFRFEKPLACKDLLAELPKSFVSVKATRKLQISLQNLGAGQVRSVLTETVELPVSPRVTLVSSRNWIEGIAEEISVFKPGDAYSWLDTFATGTSDFTLFVQTYVLQHGLQCEALGDSKLWRLTLPVPETRGSNAMKLERILPSEEACTEALTMIYRDVEVQQKSPQGVPLSMRRKIERSDRIVGATTANLGCESYLKETMQTTLSGLRFVGMNDLSLWEVGAQCGRP